ncbi:hypothetical protein MA5S0422_2961 [Mycobacteroides abscessus 5S-0422]|nr:hypothetical protein MA5S0304_2026 [Mycobacteroides abscessus 5S-0304]EIU13557.1 hypothetical protein MA5S0422_2961 [Mycobacteroides abscessus 5S-0422]EIU22095.1 hypothetical protein MA5S0708_5047 [Mycobacteroides abscessus 5S-0708]EIU24485.1 hypothetical protein MA5S0817_5006 [Mycobacteroides abscessus 5S-0817]EIU30345.1 hypothetical protein MA5S1212_4392 [Mycobacteroides abscessus 5S-1212]EIU41540.1 hypothetical protein MA5S1215_5075 [Mycobacteroides abscessus 5S-1215]
MSAFDGYGHSRWTDEGISSEQTDYAIALRIPFLSSCRPAWHYITGIVVQGSGADRDGVVPTDDEVETVAKHLEAYCAHWYRDSYRRTMREFAPFDIDGGANLGYYMKRANGGWCYRKRTWEIGPRWMPRPEDPIETIDQVIERNSGSYYRPNTEP